MTNYDRWKQYDSEAEDHAAKEALMSDIMERVKALFTEHDVEEDSTEIFLDRRVVDVCYSFDDEETSEKITEYETVSFGSLGVV